MAGASKSTSLDKLRPTEHVPIGSIKPHPRNYRTHPDDQLAHIMASIRQHGFYRPIVVAKDGTILAGHGVHAAAKKMGFEQVPITRLNLTPDEPKALKLLAGDNEISHLGIIEDRVLTELLKEIKLDDIDEGLLGTGFDDMMLANLVFVTRGTGEIQNVDAAAHWVGMPEYISADKATILMIRFRNEDDRKAALERLGLDGEQIRQFKQNSTMSMWWPPQENDDIISVRAVQEA